MTFDCLFQSETKATPDPKACNWKKYKYIVLNPLCTAATVKVEEEELQEDNSMNLTPKAPTEAWSGEVPGQIDRYTKILRIMMHHKNKNRKFY